MSTRESLKDTVTLQSSLNAIFLAIGNAYYEANKIAKQKPPGASPIVFPAAITTEAATKIKQGRSTFLDSLDQLEIMVTRTSEVLERRAKQLHPEIYRKESLAALVPASQVKNNDIDAVIGVDAKAMDPSPESMLLNGEGLLPPTETPIGELGLTGATPTVAQQSTSVDANAEIAPIAEDDIGNGVIDFGDFDTSFFDDNNFDFGMMMDD